MATAVTIHRAPWVLPIRHPAIADGALAVQSGRILAVDNAKSILQHYPAAPLKDYPDSVILPGLINAHTHLELSHLHHLSQQSAPPTFTAWIEQLLVERGKSRYREETILQAARRALAAQQKDGVVALCDIANGGVIAGMKEHLPGPMFCFKEYLGLRASGLDAILQQIEREKASYCTAHAPYSTHADLLKALKRRASQRNHLWPIHVAESAAEIEMIRQGRGEFPQFLQKRGLWDGSFQPTGIDNTGSVRYLHQVGVLDDKTLCVHCVHVAGQEIALLKESGAHVCLCPGSNRYLGVGKAPVGSFLANNILPALGTDSLASNPCISLWREMRILTEDHPAVDPALILSMATLGSAHALGLEKDLGSLEPGKKAVFLAVRLTGVLTTWHNVVAELVCNGRGPVLQICS